MGAVTTFFQAASIGSQIAGSYQEAQKNKADAELVANNLEAEANYLDLQASEVRRQGQLSVAELQAATRQNLGAMRANYGASGVKVNEGSPAEVMADYAAWQDYERQKVEYSAERAGWGFEYEAAMKRNQATNTRAAQSTVFASAIGSAFSGASRISDMIDTSWKERNSAGKSASLY